MYNLFLDDHLDPYTTKNWIVIRSYDEFIAWLNNHGLNEINEISFDHDLGTEKSGLDVAQYLIHMELDGKHGRLPEHFKYHIHSMNPIGGANIRGRLDGYFRVMNNDQEVGRGVEIL